MIEWREEFDAVVASDVGRRDGLGWEFTDRAQHQVWAVFREDGGPFPVFSATRGPGPLPSSGALEAMTTEAVSDLLAATGLTAAGDWTTRNLVAALLLASRDLVAWCGEEWAVDGVDGPAPTWAEPDAPRTPFAWLRATAVEGPDVLVEISQDDAVFALSFVSPYDRRLSDSTEGAYRSRRDVPLVRGRIEAVEVAFDTLVEGGCAPGQLTEVLLHGEAGATTLLVAAEAYGADEWHLFDESVVVLAGLDVAARLAWVPPRQPWRSTRGEQEQR